MAGSQSLRPRAGRVFLAAAVVVLAVAVLSGVAVSSYATSMAASDHALEVGRQIYEWQSTLVDAETGVRGYVASNERMFLEPTLRRCLMSERRQRYCVLSSTESPTSCGDSNRWSEMPCL